MTESEKFLKEGHVLLHIFAFAVLFMLAGHFLPKIILQYTPATFLIDVEKYHASDVNLSNGRLQLIEFERTALYSSQTEIMRTLNLVSADTNIIVYIMHQDDYMEKGESETFKEIILPENIKEGEYFWQTGITFFPDKDVSKTLDLKSNKFKVYR